MGNIFNHHINMNVGKRMFGTISTNKWLLLLSINLIVISHIHKYNACDILPFDTSHF